MEGAWSSCQARNQGTGNWLQGGNPIVPSGLQVDFPAQSENSVLLDDRRMNGQEKKRRGNGRPGVRVQHKNFS
jgi:hypothetical protein